MFLSLLTKLKESAVAVLPVTILVFILACTPLVSLTSTEMGALGVSAVCLVLGIGLFSMGADIAMTPMGEQIGIGMTKARNLRFLPLVALLMGTLITIAEPDLWVLSEQVQAVINPFLLIGTIGVGVGLFLMLSIYKIIFKKDLSALLLFFYLALFALAAVLIALNKNSMLALAFDSGGVTTGPITVPFIMALGVGIASTIGGNKHSGENSFGLVALCSIGPMLAVMLLSLFSRGSIAYTLPDYGMEAFLGAKLWDTILSTFQEVTIALGLITIFFFVLQAIVLRLPKGRLHQIGVGVAYTFVGLVLFLAAVKVGYLPIGYKLGVELAGASSYALVGFGLLVGAVVVLAEPAVHILKRQVADVTDNRISQRSLLIALCIGVAISIGLSMLRIALGFSILYYLVPGYLLSLGLSFFVPKLYTAIAFDSGGVASGPLTSSFVLPMAIGACVTLQGADKVMDMAFGVVAMVAMTPLITIQLLGFQSISKQRIRNRIQWRRVSRAEDEQIINFMEL